LAELTESEKSLFSSTFKLLYDIEKYEDKLKMLVTIFTDSKYKSFIMILHKIYAQMLAKSHFPFLDILSKIGNLFQIKIISIHQDVFFLMQFIFIRVIIQKTKIFIRHP